MSLQIEPMPAPAPRQLLGVAGWGQGDIGQAVGRVYRQEAGRNYRIVPHERGLELQIIDQIN